MGHWIYPSWWTLWNLDHSDQCSTTGVTNAMVCALLFVGWCIPKTATLLLMRMSSPWSGSGSSRFSISLCGWTLPVYLTPYNQRKNIQSALFYKQNNSSFLLQNWCFYHFDHLPNTPSQHLHEELCKYYLLSRCHRYTAYLTASHSVCRIQLARLNTVYLPTYLHHPCLPPLTHQNICLLIHSFIHCVQSSPLKCILYLIPL